MVYNKKMKGVYIMNHDFILSCESTADLPFSYVEKRNIPVIFYSYQIDGLEYEDDMLRNENALLDFYAKIKEGKLPSTSQINEFRYLEFFEELLQKGDVLHIAFGSGLTPSFKNAESAALKLKEKYPQRKLIVIDSLCACSGYGLLIDDAADLRDKGLNIDEVADYVKNNCKKINSQFFSTDMTMFRRSGRVSGSTALVASVLGICPIMHLDKEGKIIAYSKVRGSSNAILTTVKTVIDLLDKEALNKKCFVAHSNCEELALKTVDLLKKENVFDDIRILNIGTIIASHCGPGTVAVFFKGKERA